MAVLFLRPMAAQVAFADVEYWIGSGSDSTLLIIDFNDGNTDSSYFWAYRYSGPQTGEDLLNAVAAADPNLQIAIAGGFLNDVIYGSHAGLAGQPDYWSTWSGADTSSLVMNSGIATPLVNGEWFALSYTDFNPATKPSLPLPAFNPHAFAFADVDQWIGSGNDSMAMFIDFQLPGDSARLVFGYLFNDSVSAAQILIDLDQNIAGLSITAFGFLNDISYQQWAGYSGQPNYWSTWSATNIGNWYLNSGISTYVKNGELFGCSYTDFSPALRPNLPKQNQAIGLPAETFWNVSIYPNPAQDYLHIEAAGAQTAVLVSAIGQNILQSKFTDYKQLYIGDLKPGIYILQIREHRERIRVQ